MSRTARPALFVRGSAQRWGWLLILATLLWGCGRTAPTKAAIGREKFITTYVALRAAVGTVGDGNLDSARAAILRRAGVTKQDMLNFADVHGRDVAFMKGVWDEIQKRLEKQRAGSLRAH